MSNNALATLAPTNMKEAMEFAGLLAKSDIVPKDYQGKPGNVLVAIQWGMEIGLQPMQAMQNIAVINGRPSIWGDAMIALVRACPAFEYITETQTDREATCVIKRKGEPEAVRTFSMEDAKKAGLMGKSGPWTQYPKRMMQMRARSGPCATFSRMSEGMICAEEAGHRSARCNAGYPRRRHAGAHQTKQAGTGRAARHVSNGRLPRRHRPLRRSGPVARRRQDVPGHAGG